MRLMCLVLIFLGGCETVKPWERGTLQVVATVPRAQVAGAIDEA